MKIIGIVRSIGERTEKLSLDLLKYQVKEIRLVKNVKPMKNMTLECLNFGLKYKADYLVTCDADVLIKPDIVEKMISEIQNKALITGHTKSKFFGIRQGGIRIWNGNYFLTILELLEKVTTDYELQYRPERFIHETLKGKLINTVTSIHEYDQYYFHIYEKFSNQSSKLKGKSKIKQKVSLFLNSNDVDFKVAYAGFFDKEKNFKKSFPDLIEKKDL